MTRKAVGEDWHISARNRLKDVIENVDAEGKSLHSLSEITSAIKELRILEATVGGSVAGLSAWTREDIHAELRRLRALTGG